MFDNAPLALKFPGFKIIASEDVDARLCALLDVEKLDDTAHERFGAALDIAKTHILSLLWKRLPLQYAAMGKIADYLAQRLANDTNDIATPEGISREEAELLLTALKNDDPLVMHAIELCLDQLAGYVKAHNEKIAQWSEQEEATRNAAINQFIAESGILGSTQRDDTKKICLAAIAVRGEDIALTLSALKLEQHDTVINEYNEHPLVREGVATVAQIAFLNPLVRHMAAKSYLAFPQQVTNIFNEAKASLEASFALSQLGKEQWHQLVAGQYTSVKACGFALRYDAVLKEIDAALALRNATRLEGALLQFTQAPGEIEFLLTIKLRTYDKGACLLERIIHCDNAALMQAVVPLIGSNNQQFFWQYLQTHPKALNHLAGKQTSLFMDLLGQLDEQKRLEIIASRVFANEEYADEQHLNLVEWAAARGEEQALVKLRQFLGEENWLVYLLDRGEAGKTPLHRACSSGNAGGVKLLLTDLTAEIQLQQMLIKDDYGSIPLHYASSGAVIDLLKNKAPAGWTWSSWPKMVTAVTKNGETPLMHMAARGNTEAMEALLLSMSSTTRLLQLESSTNDKRNLLHLASAPEVVRLLDRKITSQDTWLDLLEAKDSQGNTPLLHAITHGRVDVASELAGHEPDLCPSSLKESPLYRAVISGHVPMAEAMLNAYTQVENKYIATHAKHITHVCQAYAKLPDAQRNGEILGKLEAANIEAGNRVPAGFVERLLGRRTGTEAVRATTK